MLSRFLAVGAPVVKELDKWSLVSSGFACLIGLVNLSRLHTSNIRRRREVWPYSVMLLVVMYVYLVIVLVQTPKGPTVSWVVKHMTGPIGSAVYAMLGFYVCSAAYRSFRARSSEAAVLMLAAVILMLAQAPIGEVLYKDFPKVGSWILTVPNSAGMRAINIGSYIGGFAAVIRVLLGLERSWTGVGGGS